jgi:hypothetical protein
MENSFDILIDALVTDDEFRHSFLRQPRMTLELADDWGLPLSRSEIRALIAADRTAWDRVADALGLQLEEAA